MFVTNRGGPVWLALPGWLRILVEKNHPLLA